MYEELAKHPARMRRFTSAMSGVASSPSFAIEHLTQNYPWASLGSATVVDIGGADGHTSVHLVKSFPNLQCIVQDRMDVIKNVRLSTSDQDAISLAAYDFLEPQYVKGDVYLLRWILHNWSDKYCIKILRNQICCLRPGAKILIMETILPEPNSLPLLQERQIR